MSATCNTTQVAAGASVRVVSQACGAGQETVLSELEFVDKSALEQGVQVRISDLSSGAVLSQYGQAQAVGCWRSGALPLATGVQQVAVEFVCAHSNGSACSLAYKVRSSCQVRQETQVCFQAYTDNTCTTAVGALQCGRQQVCTHISAEVPEESSVQTCYPGKYELQLFRNTTRCEAGRKAFAMNFTLGACINQGSFWGVASCGA